MKILYMQQKQAENHLSKPSLLENYGITDCFLRIASSADHFSTLSPKMHQHAFCEIHLILKGSQQYLILNNLYTIPAGHFLLIPADIPHQHMATEPDTQKYSVSFSSKKNASPNLAGFFENKLICKAAAKDAMNAIANIETEADSKKEYSIALIESKIFQFLLYLARDAGVCEGQMTIAEAEDPRLRFARQYIEDNIDRAVGCPEVASYCHLSQKQLSRLFSHSLGISTSTYIRSQRIVRIKQLLTESNYSLEHISEKLHFSNVYHFNSFFSKYAGVSPGRFRKMHKPGG